MSREAQKASTKRSASCEPDARTLDSPSLGSPHHKSNQQLIPRQTLNVTTSLVSQWERGEKWPQGASLKFLMLAAKNGPDRSRDGNIYPPAICLRNTATGGACVSANPIMTASE